MLDAHTDDVLGGVGLVATHETKLAPVPAVGKYLSSPLLVVVKRDGSCVVTGEQTSSGSGSRVGSREASRDPQVGDSSAENLLRNQSGGSSPPPRTGGGVGSSPSPMRGGPLLGISSPTLVVEGASAATQERLWEAELIDISLKLKSVDLSQTLFTPRDRRPGEEKADAKENKKKKLSRCVPLCLVVQALDEVGSLCVPL